MRAFLPVVFALTVACPTPDPADDDTDQGPHFDPNPSTTLGDGRVADVFLPEDYDITTTYPLVMMLHGYGANSILQDAIFGLKNRVDTHSFILVTPDGTVDDGGSQFWNAFEECCDFNGTDVDDSAWLRGLLDEAVQRYPVSHVAVMGHSNGGFMSYRMACEHGDIVDRIAPLAGTMSTKDAECAPTSAVRVLHMHGTDDDAVAYASSAGHHGAEDSVEIWAEIGNCSAPTATADVDHFSSLPDNETTVQTWDCPTGDLQLWTSQGGDHTYLFNNDTYKNELASWLTAP